MAWVRNGDYYENTLSVPASVDVSRYTPYALVDGVPVGVTATRTDAGVLVQIPVTAFGGKAVCTAELGYERAGERHTLQGGVVDVTPEGLTRHVEPHPRAALKQALVDATTVATIKTAIIAYFNAIDP